MSDFLSWVLKWLEWWLDPVPGLQNASRAAIGVGAALIISAIAGIASSLLASRSAKKQAERTAAANIDLQNQAFEKNKEQWELANEYNSPLQQMTRYRDAGLNENLIYSQGSPGNAASSSPTMQAANVDLRFQPWQIPELLSEYQDFRLKQAQTDNVRAMTDNINERTVNESLRRAILDVTGRKGEFDLGLLKELAPYSVDIRESEAQRARTGANIDLEKLDIMQRIKPETLQAPMLENERRRMQNLFLQYEDQWRKMGIQSSDNIFLRVMIRMMGQMGINPMDVIKD